MDRDAFAEYGQHIDEAIAVLRQQLAMGNVDPMFDATRLFLVGRGYQPEFSPDDWRPRAYVMPQATLHTYEGMAARQQGTIVPSTTETVVPSQYEVHNAAHAPTAVDGKASRRAGEQAMHLVSAFTTQARLILGQEACAEKSNELTAIPALLDALMLKGVIVTIDAMGTHRNIAQRIRDKEADYVLAVKDNQPKLAESITTFFEIGQAEGWKHCPYSFEESVEKGHGRHEVRRCWAFDQLPCLSRPEQWPDLKMFGVVESERTINGTTSIERRYYIGSIPADAATLAYAVRGTLGDRECAAGTRKGSSA
jgi:predicted transposase YbfD/YdcC